MSLGDLSVFRYLNFSLQCLKVLIQVFSIGFVRDTPKYIICGCCEVLSPWFFSVRLLFVYRRGTDFGWKCLSAGGVPGSSFWGLLMYTTILSANNNTLSSSFLVCPLDLLQLCIALAKNSSTILSRYGENGQPCL